MSFAPKRGYFPKSAYTHRMEPDEPRQGTARPERALTRLRASAAQLGFSPPPVALRLKLLQGPHHWSLFLQPEERSRISLLVEWLEPWSPLRIEFGSRNVIRADFDPVPAGWLARFGSVDLEMLALYPNGSALATVVGSHKALAMLGRSLSTTPGIVVSGVADAPRDAPLLTDAQDEALRAAVAAGYYRIPRPVTLHQLAAGMGLSPAALSERLRRAEGRVILRYAQEGATTPWDARTIFDAHAPDDAVSPGKKPSSDSLVQA